MSVCRVRLFEEGDRTAWDRYVLDSASSNCYHLSSWKDVIERTFGHRSFYLLAEEDGKIEGILPLVHIKSRLFGNFMVSLPYFNYGGVCAEEDRVREMLIEEAIEVASREGAEHIELRATVPFSNTLHVKTTKVSMRLRLPPDPDHLWRSFPSKLRSQIKRPTKEGMFALWGREEELESFYRVFSVNMRDLGTPVYSIDFFKAILDAFPDTTWICTVYTRDKKPVASGFLVGFKDVLEIPWASSIRRYNRFSPNMLLYWNVLRFACEKGYTTFDFGRCTPGSGTYRFKKQWGAEPLQLYWLYWLRDGGPLPELNPDNPKYRLAIKVWQRLPVRVTRLLGPPLIKRLPG